MQSLSKLLCNNLCNNLINRIQGASLSISVLTAIFPGGLG